MDLIVSIALIALATLLLAFVWKFMIKDPAFWMAAGIIFTDMNRYGKAHSCFERAVKLQPTYFDAWSNKGLTLYKLGQYEESIQSYDKALDLNPIFGQGWYNKGLALEKLGRAVEAEDAFQRAEDLGVK